MVLPGTEVDAWSTRQIFLRIALKEGNNFELTDRTAILVTEFRSTVLSSAAQRQDQAFQTHWLYELFIVFWTRKTLPFLGEDESHSLGQDQSHSSDLLFRKQDVTTQQLRTFGLGLNNNYVAVIIMQY
jgi:hypothetical protein